MSQRIKMGGSKKQVVNQTSSSLAIVEANPLDNKLVTIDAPIVSSYNDRIRPLLDTVDRLRNLNVMREGIQLPTIVVVGDQSSGKSSVLESLAGISLPRGQGICTRVPLVMRLQRSTSPEPEIWLEYGDKVVPTDEEHIAEAICAATDVIAGSGKGVSDATLTLHVKKAGVPDITMVDLPGITRVPVNGQPENIYEQIAGMIMKYIEPQESIILNVLSATVDFTTCESIRMSRQVDKTGERTLAVVTKADMAPEGLLQKVTADDVSIGLGYVCVRNRIGEETYEEARMQEEELFRSHPLLSLIDDEIVGIPVLAQKLMLIQATMIGRCLPEIVRKINQKMESAVLELNKLPMVMASTAEALMSLMDIISSAKESLLRILVQGDFSEYPDEQKMHCTARLAEMLSQFSDNLQAQTQDATTKFLMDEIKILDECKCVGLPNFIPRSAFLVNGQPENIYEQIAGMIMKYIEPQESIILNVLSATVDFTTCESIRMSRQVDKTGERTLAVVTKADMAPEGLLQKVTADDVSIGLGYVCVRNRIGEETYEEARMQEEELFSTHPMLSMIDDGIVGIPVLAHKLMQIQGMMISRCLPEIERKINEKMENSVLELSKLPTLMDSAGEALMALMDIIVSAKESLLRILVQGDFSEYSEDQVMHCTARLAEMLSEFSDNLQGQPLKATTTEFLMDEIKILDECKCVGLPNFIPRSAFLAILSQHVDGIHTKPVEFIKKIWDYIEVVLSPVIIKQSENFPQIQSSIKRAARNLMSKMKEQSVNRVTEIVEMEKLTDYTCNPDYMKSWTEKTALQQNFITAVLDDFNKPEYFSLDGFGNVEISHLRKYHAHLLQQAFDMKMRITSYWKIVLQRIVDNLALYLQFSVKNLVNSQFQKEIVAEMVDPKAGGGIQRMLEESPSVASKREKLKNSIKLLKESKDVVATIVDQNSAYGDR